MEDNLVKRKQTCQLQTIKTFIFPAKDLPLENASSYGIDGQLNGDTFMIDISDLMCGTSQKKMSSLILMRTIDVFIYMN